jgi:predicted transport protein
MPLFSISNQNLKSIEQTKFLSEKELQHLVEKNLDTLFNCRFVASEFPTGAQHSGRIDTLAISEDNNPVIIEYKKVESSELITQSLYYLAWINDHHGDFEMAVSKELGNKVQVDWSDVRVICIAPNYGKYALYAAQIIGDRLELWTYRVYKNEFLYLEEVLQKAYASPTTPTLQDNKNPVMVAAGKKAAETRATGVYTFEQHLQGKSQKLKELVLAVQEYVKSVDAAITEVPKKNYIAYKISQNIVCVEVQNQRILLFLKLKPKEIANLPNIARDMTGKGHYGTGDLEMSVRSLEELEIAKPFIEMAYRKVGG